MIDHTTAQVISNIIIILVSIFNFVCICYLVIKNDLQARQIKRYKLHIAMLYDELTAAQRAQHAQEETFIVWREMWTDEKEARGN